MNFIDWNCGRKNPKKILTVSDATYCTVKKSLKISLLDFNKFQRQYQREKPSRRNKIFQEKIKSP